MEARCPAGAPQLAAITSTEGQHIGVTDHDDTFVGVACTPRGSARSTFRARWTGDDGHSADGNVEVDVIERDHHIALHREASTTPRTSAANSSSVMEITILSGGPTHHLHRRVRLIITKPTSTRMASDPRTPTRTCTGPGVSDDCAGGAGAVVSPVGRSTPA